MVLQEEELTCNISTTACFTGHRPSGLPFSQPDATRNSIIKSMLYERINDAVDQGYTTFISGMAKGVDIWCALAVISLRSSYPGLELIGVSPYRKEICRLKGTDLWNYSIVSDSADKMIYISEDYHPRCYFERNMYMVDHSSLVIGAVSNMYSGTGNTIRYAERKGRNMDIININSLRNVLKI